MCLSARRACVSSIPDALHTSNSGSLHNVSPEQINKRINRLINKLVDEQINK